MKKVLAIISMFAFLAVASLGFGATYNQPLYGSYDAQIMGMLDAGKDHTNYLTIDVAGANATWNTAAAHKLLMVTGMVRVRLIAECVTPLTTAAGATIELGTENNPAEIIAQTVGTDLDATEIWSGATPDIEAVAYGSAALDTVVVQGSDIALTVATDALTGGVIRFHVWWTPLSADGNVTIGAGGPF